MDRLPKLADPKLHKIRFSLDSLNATAHGNDFDAGERFKAFAHLQHLQINNSVTPFLYASLNKVLERIGVSLDRVEAFVYNSAEMQAECFSITGGKCVLRFSSGLIDILTDEEFQFVIGHELGHYIYGHQGLHLSEKPTYRQLKSSRYQEISADRVGLIASGSLEVAIKALMKSSSGLAGKHLRFDVGTYLNQLRAAGNHSSYFEEQSTHPSTPLRCKALFWFSMVDKPLHIGERTLVNAIEKADKQVEKDLIKYSEANTYQLSLEISAELNFWKELEEISLKGKLTKADQEHLEKFYGPEILNKVLRFIQGKSPSEVVEHTRSRVLSFQRELHDLGY